jgi:hypothetical protein
MQRTGSWSCTTSPRSACSRRRRSAPRSGRCRCAHLVGYWRGAVRSGDYSRLGMYAVEAYDIFKVGVFFSAGFLVFLMVRSSDCVVADCDCGS